jgi:uncharacterized SAM-binding protein YcdF (DUF218 family)
MFLFFAAAFALLPTWFLLRSSRRGWLMGLRWVAAASCLALMAVQARSLIEVQKFISYMLLPTGLLWLGLLAVVLGLLAERRWKWFAATLLLWLAYTATGNVYVGTWLMRLLENDVPPVAVQDLPKMDAVFVLGGGTDRAPDGMPQLNNSGDRVFKAAAIYHAGITPVLVCSGTSFSGFDKEGHKRDQARDTAALWTSVGVPATAIRMIPGALVTSSEVASYKDLILGEGWRRVGLVSSAWHLPRALRSFKRLGLEKQGVEIVPIGSDYMGNPGLIWSPIWAVPRWEGFQLVNRAVWELGGMLVGR